MFRKHYILFLIVISIRNYFCYHNEPNINSNQMAKKVFAKQSRQESDKYRNPKVVDVSPGHSVRSQDYDTFRDNEQVALINIADFIQPEAELMEHNDAYFYTKDKRRNPAKIDTALTKEDSEGIGSNNEDYTDLEEDNSPINPYPLQTRKSEDLTLNSLSKESYGKSVEKYKPEGGHNFLDDLSFGLHHKVQKKSPYEHIRVPFFYHKTKSRGLCGNNRVKDYNSKYNKNELKEIPSLNAQNSNHYSNLNSEFKNPYKSNKQGKRSYTESLCPICKKRFVKFYIQSNNKRSYVPLKNVHNSRQYFQRLSEAKNENQDVESSTEEDELNEPDQLNGSNDIPKKNPTQNYKRRKRFYIDADKARQMKELDELQKKIDNADLYLPVMTKHHTIPTTKY